MLICPLELACVSCVLCRALAVILSGFRVEEAYLNGLYSATSGLVNGAAHFTFDTSDPLAPTTPITAHLFYSPDSEPAAAWIVNIGSIVAPYPNAYVNTDASAPFSAAWKKKDAINPTIDVLSLTATLMSNCTALGTPASLESSVCFGGAALLGSPAATLPAQCTLSCAHYLPYISKQCNGTSAWNAQPRVSSALNTLASLPSCASQCNYSTVAKMMQRCPGFSLASSDVTQDLLSVLNLPTGACDSICAAEYLPFYSSCVATRSMGAPARYTAFAAKCQAIQTAPEMISSMTLVDATHDALLVSWPPPAQIYASPTVLTYQLESSLSGAPWVTVAGASAVRENSFRITGLSPSTTYALRVRATNTVPLSGAPSSALNFTTRNMTLNPPSWVLPTLPLSSVNALGASFPSTFSTQFTWASAGPALDTIYQLSVTASSAPITSGLPVFGRESTAVIYTGSDLSFTYSGLSGGTVYLVAVSARSLASNTVWSIATNATFTTPFVDPVTPLPVTVSSVSATGATVSWMPVASCGASSCEGASYRLESQYNGLSYTNIAAGGMVVTPGGWQAVSPLFPFQTGVAQYNYTFTSLQAGSDYAFRVVATASYLPSSSTPSDAVSVSLPPNLPAILARPNITAVSSGELVVFWPAGAAAAAMFFDDGRGQIEEFHLKATPSLGGAAIETYVAAANVVSQTYSNGLTGPTFRLSGLSASTSYVVSMRIRNAAGWSAANAAPLTTPTAAVVFSAFSAYDPTPGSRATFSSGSALRLDFLNMDLAAPAPDVSSPSAIAQLIEFSAAIPASYTGAWNGAGTLTITIGPLNSGALASSYPRIGLFSARLIGNLSSTPSPCLINQQVLLGSWGSASLATTSRPHLLEPLGVYSMLQGSADFYPLHIPVNTASMLVSSVPLTITFKAGNGMLAYPFYSGSTPSTPDFRRAPTIVVTTVYGALLSSDPTVNPLLAVSYTPASSFFGLDFLTVSLAGSGSGPTAEEFSYPFLITQINHAPIVVLPAFAPGYSVLSTTGVALTGLAVGDADQASNRPLRLTLSATGGSGSEAFSLSSDLPASGVSGNIVRAGQRTAVLQLSVTPALMSSVLGSLRFQDPNLDVDATAPLQILVHVEDAGSGVVGVSSMPPATVVAGPLSTDAIYTLQPVCVNAPAPVLLSAIFSFDLTSVSLQFDSRFKTVFPLGTTASTTPSTSSCELFLSPTAVAKLGSGASCTQSESDTLLVRLGPGSTLLVGDTLDLLSASTVIRRCSQANTWAAVGSAVVDAPLYALQPAVVLQAPTSVGTCQDLVLSTILLNATAAASNSAAGSVKYIWSAEDLSSSAVTTAMLLGVDAGSLSASPRIVVPAARLWHAGLYRFTVQVVNGLGLASALANVTVTKTAWAIPALQAVSPLIVTSANFLAPLQIDARVSTVDPECVDTLRADQQQIVYSWSSMPAVTSDPVSSRSVSSLVLGANVLRPATTYTFTLSASYASDTSRVSQLTFVVTTVAASLAIEPSRSSMLVPWRSASSPPPALVPFVEPITEMFVATGAVSLTWTCAAMTSSAVDSAVSKPCVRRSTGTLMTPVVVSSASPDLSLDLSPGSYVLTVSGPLDSTSALAAGVAPTQVILATTTVTVAAAAQFPSVRVWADANTVFPSSSLVLSSAVDSEGFFAFSSRAWTYRWSLSSVTGGGRFDTQFADASITTGVATDQLSINAATTGLVPMPVLPAGATLTFRCTVTDPTSGMSGWAEIAVDVRAPPFSAAAAAAVAAAGFSVSPATGIASSTLFTVDSLSAGWASPADLSALRFEYAYQSWMDPSVWIPFGRAGGSASDADWVHISGDPAQSYALTIRCVISDSLGASATVTQQLWVMPNATLAGPSVTAVAARSTLRTAVMSTLVSAQDYPALLSFLNLQASTSAFQSVNLTVGGLLFPGVQPRCVASATLLTAATQWPTDSLVPDANGGLGSTMTAAMLALAAAEAASLTELISLVTAAESLLGSSTLGTIMTGGAGAQSALEAVQLCNALANHAGAASSLALVNRILALGFAVLTRAVDSSAMLCTSESSSRCVESQTALLSSITSASVAMMSLASFSSVVTGVPVPSFDATTFSQFGSGLIGTKVVRSLAANDVLRSEGQSVALADCSFPVSVRRDRNDRAAVLTFAANDGSKVSYGANTLTAQQVSNTVTIAAAQLGSMLVDSRATYQLDGEYTWATNAASVTLVAGIVSFNRMLPALNNELASIVAGAVTVFTLRFDQRRCAAPVCSPRCVLWDSTTQAWSSSSITGGWSVSSNMAASPSTGLVDCSVWNSGASTATAGITVSAQSGPYVPAPSSTASSFTPISASSSSTGSSGMVSNSSRSSSTGSSGSYGVFGPLGSDTPSAVLPAAQGWAVNATLRLEFDAAILSPAFTLGLAIDLANSAGISAARVQVYALSAGSVLASFYIQPSSAMPPDGSPTPAQAYARLFAQLGNSSSVLLRGAISGANPAFLAANHFVAVQCPDSLFYAVCPSSGSSTGVAVVGDGGSGSSFFVSGTNLLIFILVLAVGVPLLILLCVCSLLVSRKAEAQAKLDKIELDKIVTERASMTSQGKFVSAAEFAATLPRTRVPLPPLAEKGSTGRLPAASPAARAAAGSPAHGSAASPSAGAGAGAAPLLGPGPSSSPSHGSAGAGAPLPASSPGPRPNQGARPPMNTGGGGPGRQPVSPVNVHIHMNQPPPHHHQQRHGGHHGHQTHSSGGGGGASPNPYSPMVGSPSQQQQQQQYNNSPMMSPQQQRPPQQRQQPFGPPHSQPQQRPPMHRMGTTPPGPPRQNQPQQSNQSPPTFSSNQPDSYTEAPMAEPYPPVQQQSPQQPQQQPPQPHQTPQQSQPRAGSPGQPAGANRAPSSAFTTPAANSGGGGGSSTSGGSVVGSPASSPQAAPQSSGNDGSVAPPLPIPSSESAPPQSATTAADPAPVAAPAPASPASAAPVPAVEASPAPQDSLSVVAASASASPAASPLGPSGASVGALPAPAARARSNLRARLKPSQIAAASNQQQG